MSTIEPIIPGGVGDFGGGPISVVGGGIQIQSVESRWMVLAQLLLDSGLEYLAIRDVALLGRTYDGRVQRWGRVEWSLAPLTGMPQTGDATFRIADTDYRWRDLAARQALRGRTIRLKFVRADDSADNYLPFFTGEIVSVASGPGYVEITARDMSWSWMDETIPPLLTAANFPYILAESDGAFAKIVIGTVDDSSPTGTPTGAEQQGAIALTHIGVVGAVDRYGAFRHRIFDISIYRRTTAGGEAFFPVDPAEYTVSVVNLVVDGYTYEMTFVDFLAVQESGTQIRANVEGLYFRPAVGDLPAEGYDPILNPGATPGVLRNPVDGFLNLMRLEFRKATLFAIDRIAAVRSLFNNIELLSSGFTSHYEAAGVVEDEQTARALLGRYLPCFNLDMYHNRSGEIALNFTNKDPEPAPLFSDNRLDGPRQNIERESFYESDPSPVANRCVLPAFRHYAAGVWLWTGVFDNYADQAVLAVPRRNPDDSLVFSGGVAVRDPRIEPITSEFWFCRHLDTIRDVAARRMSFASLGSYQQFFDVATPELIEDVELGHWVFVTHRAGRVPGGYAVQALKVLGIAHDFSTFRTTLTTIRGIPGTVITPPPAPEIPPLPPVTIYGAATIIGESELELLP